MAGQRQGDEIMRTKTDIRSIVAVAGLLAVAGSALPASAAAAEPATEVVGSTTCTDAPSSIWNDDELIVYSCSFDVADERLMGEVETVVACDFTVDGATTLGQCAGTSAIHNEGGAWGGVFSGTTTWSDDAPAHVHEMRQVYLGTGDYEGLRFEGTFNGIDFPWTVSGRIESVE
jgi:uncharacterized membrane protein